MDHDGSPEIVIAIPCVERRGANPPATAPAVVIIRLEVTVAGGVARLGDGATIAGGTAVMADLFALLMAGRPAGRLAESAALQAAVVVTATTPARILGRDELGTLRPGSSAAFAVV